MGSGNLETAFSIDTSSIKFGAGVTNELGIECKRLGANRVMVLTDPNMNGNEAVVTGIDSLRSEDIDAVLFNSVSVEPTDVSFKEAIEFASDGEFDGFVAIGGGSSIDTAKVANLYTTFPADFLTYVNAPIGKGVPVPGKLRPLVAVPTTTGTGSETTGVAIFDFIAMGTKTGIAHRFLRPDVGIVDPDNTRTLPAMVVASSGFDVLSHGLESYTALPFSEREAPDSPLLRPAYQGSNPISDIWSTNAIKMVARSLIPAAKDPDDYAARSELLLAATFAGVGFGNAGCHIPHGMSYPVSGMAKDFQLKGYPDNVPLCPHGISVILNAPAVFRFTAPTNPERHLRAAELMGANRTDASLEDAGELLADSIITLIRALDIPNGLNGIGFTNDDVDDLVTGALPQKRVLGLSPRPVGRQELKQLFSDSMQLW
tara:strand:+ start:736 stop:2022 length:1287 start_codon:yes stop_codon:yes gene_type:complete